MLKKEEVELMVNRYLESIGLSKESTYNEEKKAWYWTRGSARIEVFIESIRFSDGFTREYLRIFSPLMQVPANGDLLQLYRQLLELNFSNLGMKITAMPNSPWIYVTYERDIRGVDYDELTICISDLEWWADKLDDELKAIFGPENVSKGNFNGGNPTLW